MNKVSGYRQCTRCVMDTTASGIEFDEKGVCNFCRSFEKLAEKTIWRPKEVRIKELNDAVTKIKKLGKNDKYDCLIGLSGGVDSSYICYWAKQVGLRPLVVHFDNGWNSELAIKNIENIISKTGFDYYAYVINWEDFKDLQLAYIKASVIDIEVPTDQLIYASLHKIARKYKIKSIINGNNISSEGILPETWYFPDKLDIVNLTEIHKRFGTRKLKNFPKLGLTQQFINARLYSMYSVPPLNLMDYDKNEAKKILTEEFGWRDYGGKHYESIFTRFYQGYILPKKFNVDKRKAHLSSLVASHTITREEAIEELKKPTYDPALQKEDYEYALKKFGISKEEFEKYMHEKPVEHKFYGSQWDKKHFRKYYIFKKLLGPALNFISKFKK
ncbi:MAG: N-acetyl sugar amidotransferase [Bacteroidetes bacterium]|nr:N-acetyl sugar amidotransferase [Bacteroidota bacterium]